MLGDSAYSAGKFRAHLNDRDLAAVIKPQPLNTAVPGGFTLDDFTIDRDTGTVTCPEGITVTISPAGSTRFGAHCRARPVRTRCTTASNGRVIVLHPYHDLLAAARRQADTPAFDDIYLSTDP